ncbi:MAG: sensor histidine kinase [Blastocatellia bacterium]
MERNTDRFKLLLAGLWLMLTVALAGWWMIFGLRQLDRLSESAGDRLRDFDHYHRMLLWEGGVLIVLLLGGGVALLWYIRSERRRHRRIEEFFAAFTHDAKTALASLQLQAESLCEDLASDAPNPILARLLKDTLRLQLQLENSLFLVNLRSGRLLSEALQVSRIVESLRFHWPDVGLKLIGDGAVRADIRALESVLTNLVQNAVIHGQADLVTITVRPVGSDRLQVLVADDGRGFHGDFSQLGSLFTRHTKSSGSGVGLYISRQLVKRMGGALTFASGPERGFVAALSLPQAAPGDLSARAKQVAA